MKQLISHSENETRKIAKRLAKKITHGVIALTGELGAGKTIFVQGFAQGAGIKEKIISPTFVLIRQHKIPSGSTLYHVDLYRLDGQKNIEELGLKELMLNPKNIVLIEWAEKAENILPKETTRIDIKKDANKRIITIY